MPIPTHSYDPSPDGPAPERRGPALFNDERTLAMAAHLVGLAGLAVPFGHLLGPLVVYLVQRERSAFVADHAREALNFQIWTTAVGVLAVAGLVASVAVDGERAFLGALVLTGVLVVAWLGAVVVGAARAIEGARYRYPLTLRLLKPPASGAVAPPADADAAGGSGSGPQR